MQVIDIWHKHLTGIIKVRTKTPLVARGPGPVFDDEIEEEDKLGKLAVWSANEQNASIGTRRLHMPLGPFLAMD